MEYLGVNKNDSDLSIMNRYLQQNSNSDLNQFMQAINSDSPVNKQKRLLKWDSHSIGHINDGQKVFKNKQYSSKIAEIKQTNQSQQIENSFNIQNPSISIYRAHEKQNTFSYVPAISANSAKLIQETQKSQQSLKSFQTQTSQISQQQHVFDKESPIVYKLFQLTSQQSQGFSLYQPNHSSYPNVLNNLQDINKTQKLVSKNNSIQSNNLNQTQNLNLNSSHQNCLQQVQNSKLLQPYDMKNQGLNMLVYGTKCELYQKLKQNKQQECIMALDPYIEYQIQLMDFQNNKINCIKMIQIFSLFKGARWTSLYHIAQELNDCVISVLLTNQTKVSLKFQNKFIRNIIYDTLQNLIIENHFINVFKVNHFSVNKIIDSLEFKNRNTFTFKNVKQIFNKLNIKVSDYYLNKLFDDQVTQQKSNNKNKNNQYQQQKQEKPTQLKEYIKKTEPINNISDQKNNLQDKDKNSKSNDINIFLNDSKQLLIEQENNAIQNANAVQTNNNTNFTQKITSNQQETQQQQKLDGLEELFPKNFEKKNYNLKSQNHSQSIASTSNINSKYQIDLNDIELKDFQQNTENVQEDNKINEKQITYTKNKKNTQVTLRTNKEVKLESIIENEDEYKLSPNKNKSQDHIKKLIQEYMNQKSSTIIKLKISKSSENKDNQKSNQLNLNNSLNIKKQLSQRNLVKESDSFFTRYGVNQCQSEYQKDTNFQLNYNNDKIQNQKNYIAGIMQGKSIYLNQKQSEKMSSINLEKKNKKDKGIQLHEDIVNKYLQLLQKIQEQKQEIQQQSYKNNKKNQQLSQINKEKIYQIDKMVQFIKQELCQNKINTTGLISIIKTVMDQSQIKNIFDKYVPTNLQTEKDNVPCMPYQKLQEFFLLEQKEDVDVQEVQQLINFFKLQNNIMIQQQIEYYDQQEYDENFNFNQNNKFQINQNENDKIENNILQKFLYEEKQFLRLVHEKENEDIAKFMLFNEDIANVKENIQAQLNNFKAEEQDDQMLDQQDNMIQFSHFLQIILSVRNSIFDPKKEIQNTEADQPLNNFFICAAKNIYKYNPNISKIISVEYIVEKFQVNDQNTSYENPDIDPCKRITKEIISQNLPLFYVLLKGYRYLNFEIWEGPKNGEPVIKSGFDGQQNILFADILVILVQYAFFQTSNPLILHLDLHLSTASKFLLQEILKKILSYHLYSLPYNYKEILKYPTLEEFQYRILVSGIVFNMEELAIPQGQKQISLMSLNKFDYEISKIDNLLDSCNQIQDYDSNLNEEKQQTQISQLTSKSQAYQELDVQTQIQMEYIDFQPQSDEIDKDMQKFTNEEENYDIKKQMAIQNFFDNKIIKKPRLKHYLESIYEDAETKQQRIESQKRRSKVAPPIIIRTLQQMNIFTKDFDNIKNQQNIESLYGLYDVKFFNNNYYSLWELYSVSLRQLEYLCHIQKINKFKAIQQTAAQNLTSMKNFNKLFITKVDNTQKNQNQVNFQISDALRQGCQIILNNPLTFDLNNLIYESFFQQNGNNKTGFVLKPEFLRQHQYNNVNNESSFSERLGQIYSLISLNKGQYMTFKIQFISAYQLYPSKFYSKEMNLKIEVFVKKPIQLKKDLKIKKKTQLDKYVQNVNEYNWQKEHISEFFIDQEYFKEEVIGNNNVNPKLQLQFQFSVKKPQFSFLCFQVIDTKQSTLIGWYALPCNCIRQGYRVIPLKDELFNTINNSYIFCKIQQFVNQ